VLGPGGVIPSDPSDSRSLHRWEREVCAAQFPASRGAPFTISHDAPPSGGTPLPTLSLEWTSRLRGLGGPTRLTSIPVLAATWLTGNRDTTQQGSEVSFPPMYLALLRYALPEGRDRPRHR